MIPDHRFTALYLAALVTFTATECYALASHQPGRTFTSQTRWAEAALPGPARWLARVTILGLTTWAGIHLAEGLA